MLSVKKEKIKYNKFICDFAKKIESINGKYSELIFICVGTDRITGDCFGPIVGERLIKNLKNNQNFKIYGTLSKNVSFSSIDYYLNKIKQSSNNPYIVIIDSALSTEENIGKIFIENKKTRLGNAIGKSKKNIGDMSIRAIIGENFQNINKNMYVLQNTHLSLVISLANIVSQGILEVLNEELFLKVSE